MGPRIQGAVAFVSAAQIRPIQHSIITAPRNSMRSLRLRAAPVPESDYVTLEENSVSANEKLTLPYLDSDILSPGSSSESGETSAVAKNVLASSREDAPSVPILLLNIVAVIWGTQHAVIKMVVDDSEAAPFTLLRFAVAALVASPYTPGLPFGISQKSSSPDTSMDAKTEASVFYDAWRWGAEMGLWMFLGFSFQAIGLASTTAQRSGFLLYLNVKFVPFFARVLLGRPIAIPTWISAFVAFCGTALLALDGQSMGFNEGDFWSIAAAASSALFILRLEKATKAVPEAAQLNAACLWVVTILAALWTFSGGGSFGADPTAIVGQLFDIATSHPIEILYLGGVTTAFANYIQTKAQKEISPERASIIYSLDPVYGSFFSWLLLGETLGGPQAFVGAGLVTVAAATNAFLDFGNKESSSGRKDEHQP